MKTKIEKQEFWRNHCTGYNTGNVSLVEYCKSAGFNRHTFQYWREKFREEKVVMTTKPKSAFVRVVPKSAPSAVKTSGEVVARVKFSNGLALECLSWPEPQWLEKISRPRHD